MKLRDRYADALAAMFEGTADAPPLYVREPDYRAIAQALSALTGHDFSYFFVWGEMARRNLKPHAPEEPPAELRPEAAGEETHEDGSRTITTDPNPAKCTARDILIETGYDPDEWIIERARLNRWNAHAVIDGQWEPTTNYQHKITIRPRVAYVLVLPAPLSRTPHHLIAPPAETGRPRTFLVTTDMQIPFHHFPLHELSLRIADDLRVDRWLDLGDFWDLPMLSKWREKPNFTTDLQASIDSGAAILQERRQAAPAWCTKELWLGNHDQRMDNWIIDHAKPLYGLRRAQIGPPEHESVLSLSYLSHATELGWLIRDQYPYNEAEILPGLIGFHGERVLGGAGNTVRQELTRRNHSLIQGHVNNLCIISLTRSAGENQHFTVYGIEAGLMCRREGSLGFGSPTPDWSLGLVSLTVWPDGTWHPTLGRYDEDSRTLYHGTQRWTLPRPF